MAATDPVRDRIAGLRADAVRSSDAYRWVRETAAALERAGPGPDERDGGSRLVVAAAAGSAAGCDGEAAVDALDARLCQDFARLGKQAEAVFEAIRQSIENQVERPDEKSREAESVSYNVVAAAVLMIVSGQRSDDALDPIAVGEELAGRMREKGLWLESDLATRPLMIHGDRDRLSQVIENLYENAVKFSAVASTLSLALSTVDAPTEHVSAGWRRQLAQRHAGRFALLAVSDSGTGVPDDHKEKIFEQFYQVEKAPTKGLRSGVGLGLAISREIVEAHHGALWVRDNPDVGSTFYLLLPIDPRGVTRPRRGATATLPVAEEGSACTASRHPH